MCAQWGLVTPNYLVFDLPNKVIIFLSFIIDVFLAIFAKLYFYPSFLYYFHYFPISIKDIVLAIYISLFLIYFEDQELPKFIMLFFALFFTEYNLKRYKKKNLFFLVTSAL